MRVIDQLVYKIVGDNNQFDSAINKSDAKMDGIQKRGQGLSTFMKGAFVAGFLVAGKAVIDLGLKLGNIASDAEETNNKFAVTFSGIRDEAEATAKNLSDNFGLSTLASKTLLSSTGDLLTGFGFTQEASLDLSNQVNELAVDLASFTNFSGGAEGASAALTKALLGERESVKSLGISIMEADIKQLAEDKGIVGELTRQQKAMLTLEIAVSQSKNAIGDFARSQDAYANQKRIFEGNLEDLAVKLGDRLLPMMTAVVGAGNDIVEFLVNGKNPSDELANSTDLLAGKSKELSEITATLAGDVDTLTESERLNLISKQALLRLEIVGDISEQSDNYDKLNKNIAKNTELNELDNELIRRNLADLTKLSITEGVSVERLIERAAAWDTFKVSADDVNNILEANEVIESRIKDRTEESTEAIANKNLFIERTAYLVSEGILKEEAYATATQGLKDEINRAIIVVEKEVDVFVKQDEAITEIITDLDQLQDATWSTKKSTDNLTVSNNKILSQFDVLGTVLPELTQDQIDQANSTYNTALAYERLNKEVTTSGDYYKTVMLPVLEKFNADVVIQGEQVEKLTIDWQRLAEDGLGSFTRGFQDVGEALYNGEDAWEAFARAGKLAVASVLEGLGAQLAAMAVIEFLKLNFAGGILAVAGSAAAYTAAGAVSASAVTPPPSRSEDTGATRTIQPSTQSRSISPSSNATNGDVYLDGEKVGRIVLNHANSGRLGVIDKRVVK
jgi:hypothetical protein